VPVEEALVEIVNLGEKFARIHDYWNPRIAGELNDSYVKLVKLEPRTTLNTGNVVEERTVRQEGRI
jgi:hypothetical protein